MVNDLDLEKVTPKPVFFVLYNELQDSLIGSKKKLSLLKCSFYIAWLIKVVQLCVCVCVLYQFYKLMLECFFFRKLSLSTNSIEKIANLNGLSKSMETLIQCLSNIVLFGTYMYGINIYHFLCLIWVSQCAMEWGMWDGEVGDRGCFAVLCSIMIPKLLCFVLGHHYCLLKNMMYICTFLLPSLITERQN